MTKFQLGDRVQYVGEPSDYDVGTVQVVNTYANGEGTNYRVAFDVSGDVTFDEHELYLVVAKAPAEPDMVEHPPNYNHPSGIEVIDITRHETFLRGNIIKYVLRAPYKGTEIEDLKKARQYLDWEIARCENAS